MIIIILLIIIENHYLNKTYALTVKDITSSYIQNGQEYINNIYNE